jgi:succinate dehydrogenase / fumarate reductase cytochrome b subunit
VATKPAGPRKRAVYGTPYRGREGQWSWILHRATGVGIILFLFAHVVDTAVIGWGPEAYEKVLSVYHNPFVLTLELALVGMVLFHALNGIRIMIIDFWPKAAEHHVAIFWTTMAVFAAAMAPVTYIIGKSIIEAL